MVIKRGEIWWAELPAPSASEPGYRRPLVVIQSNEFNKSKINTVIAAVITSNLHLSEAPGNVLIPPKQSRLPKRSVVNVSQLITIDKSFLIERVHNLPDTTMNKIDDGIRLVLKI
ncbi:MAG TPA: type II toxin-antitoxin system PemK/MazF family toxin [Desulfobulbaceae bacterium]|nr:type II toxin-antitoxin system PemK/MazF family toxin [Desulfobulbaceae bacterium]